MKTTIYVVLTYVDYEGSEMVKAFTTEEAAEAFQQRCEQYHATKLHGGSVDVWLDNHPAGTGAYCVDGFITRAVELAE